MYDDEWVDTRHVCAHIEQHRGRIGWAVTEGTNVLASGACADAGELADARLAIMLALRNQSHLQSAPVELKVSDKVLRDHLVENYRDRTGQPKILGRNIEPLDGCRVSTHDPDLDFAVRSAVAAADKAGPVVLVAATDGARERHAPVGGYGWFISDGRYGHGELAPKSPVEAELAAISALLKETASEASKPLVIYVDSAHAIALAVEALAGRRTSAKQSTAVGHVLTRIAAHAGREVSIRKVSGHSGDPLNDAAHRLAVLKRRETRMNISEDTVEALAAQIAAETCALLSA